jgi:hypothetical protein
MGIPMTVDADRHRLVAGARLRAVGAEQAVPPGQIEPEVAIGLAPLNRVVNDASPE